MFYGETRTFRFSPSETTFDSPTDSPENACYCLTQPCLPSGLLDISGCKPGSPIYMSWPHFMYGDPQLRKDIEGMSPDPEKHSFQFDVVPVRSTADGRSDSDSKWLLSLQKYGISLAARARLQMNVIVKPDKDFTWFQDIPREIVLPFAWLEEGVFGPNEVRLTCGICAAVRLCMAAIKRPRHLEKVVQSDRSLIFALSIDS